MALIRVFSGNSICRIDRVSSRVKGKKMILTSFNCRTKNVRILPVVITKLELGNIERHIFSAHFVECTDDASLKDRPETLDGLSVDRADDVLTSGVVNHAMRIFAVTTPVTC